MSYADKILEISRPYLVKTFSKGRLEAFLEDYIRFVKEDFQEQYQGINEVLSKVHLMVTSPPYFAALLQRPLAVVRDLNEYLEGMQRIMSVRTAEERGI
ncbi:MAG: hypothetical protein C4B55_06350 [Candidatus Methanophagaceae archaeon]|nr:MAG: hypothetical protein C4B55_06350 [Methanophagales archaeon]